MDYSKGKIYLIECSISKQKYIGSTIRTLEERFAAHRKNMNRENGKLCTHMKTYGINNFNISLLEEYPCNNKRELEKREAYYQRLHNTVDKGLNSIYAQVPKLPESIKRMNEAKYKREYRAKKKLIEENKQKMLNFSETDKESAEQYEKIKIEIENEEKRYKDTMKMLNDKLIFLESKLSKV